MKKRSNNQESVLKKTEDVTEGIGTMMVSNAVVNYPVEEMIDLDEEALLWSDLDEDLDDEEDYLSSSFR